MTRERECSFLAIKPPKETGRLRTCWSTKGKMLLTEVKAMNGEQAANAAAGIDALIARLQMLAEIRAAAPNASVAAGLMLADCPAEKDVLDGAMRAIDESADEAMGLRRRFRAMPTPMATG